MKVNLELREEEQEKALVWIATYQQQLTSYYNKKTKNRQFQPRDLVLRKTFVTTPTQGPKKMKPNWEGLYMIHQSEGRGNYTLDTLKGKEISRQMECPTPLEVLSMNLLTYSSAPSKRSSLPHLRWRQSDVITQISIQVLAFLSWSTYRSYRHIFEHKLHVPLSSTCL